MIDVPVCFKKSPSLKRRIFELPLLKFSNYLMKKGNREQTFRLLFGSFLDLFNQLKFDKFNADLMIKSWNNLYFLLNTDFWGKTLNRNDAYSDGIHFHNDSLFLPVLFDNFFTHDWKLIDNSFYIKNYLSSKLGQILPIFSYFIYSVDKNIKKYSRGKSGKYVFIWKYIAPYKRFNLAMKWIAKEIKFSSDKQVKDRIVSTLKTLIFDSKNSFAWKSKVFSHNYVFRNLRKTLMSTLKTSSIS